MLQRIVLEVSPSAEEPELNSSISQLASLLKKQPGFVAGYWGKRIENHNVADLLIFWTDHARYQNFTKSPSHDSFSTNISSIATSTATHLSSLQPAHPVTVLAAPVVEMLSFTNLTSKRHLDPVQLPKFRGLLAQSGTWVGDAVGPGLDGATGEEAPIQEGDASGTGSNWLILGGWESVEAHKAFQASEAFGQRPKVDGKVRGWHVIFKAIG